MMSMLVTFSFKIKITQCYHYFEQTYHSYNLLFVECSFFQFGRYNFVISYQRQITLLLLQIWTIHLTFILEIFLFSFGQMFFLSALKLTVILAPTVKDRSTWIHIKPMSQTSFFSLPAVILSFLISTKCGRQNIE